MKIVKIAFVIVGIFVAASCGGAPTGDGGGALAVKVIGAKGFNPRIAPGRVERYAVKIEGPGIASPIVAEFPGDAESGLVEGVPVGEGRVVSVTAMNANAATILAGETPGVGVDDGLTTVEIALEAVPIFTNLADGAAVDNTRLVFHLFSNPAHSVVVEEMGGGDATALADASTGGTEIELDASTGLGVLAPVLLSPGDHRFSVRDVATGRFSSAEVRLLDGARRKGAPFVAAGRSGEQSTTRVSWAGEAR